jgi:hypothetical protein
MVLNSLYDIITRFFLLKMLSQEPELATGANSPSDVGSVGSQRRGGPAGLNGQDPMDSRYRFHLFLAYVIKAYFFRGYPQKIWPEIGTLFFRSIF